MTQDKGGVKCVNEAFLVLQWSPVGQAVLEATCPAEGRCVFCRVHPEKTYHHFEKCISQEAKMFVLTLLVFGTGVFVSASRGMESVPFSVDRQ